MPIRTLTKELQEIAINELNEVPSRIQADLDHIREWISKQPHLNARTDDQWLLSFLRCSKFSLQRTKEKLDFYYTVRNITPEFYSNRDPFLPEIQELLSMGTIVVLPKTGYPGGPRVTLCRAKRLYPAKFNIATIMKLATMLTDILLMEDDNFVVAGTINVVDAKEHCYSLMAQATPDFIRKAITCFQNVYTIRVQQITWINTPASIVTVYNMFKRFIREKIRNRTFLYGEDDLTDLILSKGIPLSILPEEYGGEEVSYDKLVEYWKKKVESYRDWFLEDSQYCTDESKRPNKPKTGEELYGTEGSFIQLEID